MKKHLATLFLIITTLSLNAQSEHQNNRQEELAIIAALVNNNWSGTGTLMGKEAKFTMNWQKVLNSQFVKLEFQNEQKSGDNQSVVFKATAFYKIVNGEVVGHWFDNRGVTFPLKGSVNESELVILWGDDQTEKGKTVYHYVKNTNEITVEDFVLNDGQYFKFGNATYKANQ